MKIAAVEPVPSPSFMPSVDELECLGGGLPLPICRTHVMPSGLGRFAPAASLSRAAGKAFQDTSSVTRRKAHDIPALDSALEQT